MCLSFPYEHGGRVVSASRLLTFLVPRRNWLLGKLGLSGQKRGWPLVVPRRREYESRDL
jgi:hypothetical protein